MEEDNDIHETATPPMTPGGGNYNLNSSNRLSRLSLDINDKEIENSADDLAY